MADRRTQSYAAVPRSVSRDDISLIETDPVEAPDDLELPLPPSPTFWPRDEPKEPGR